MNIDETKNYLTLIKLDKAVGSNRYGLFRCVCGTEKILRISSVKSGSTKSCGCHRKKQARINGCKVVTHGMTNTSLYKFWQYFTQTYKGYIDETWLSFENFKDWCINWKPGLTICRLDSSINFGPNNCILQDKKISKQVNRKHTNINKYGIHNPQSLLEVKEKSKNTSLAKYGVENPSQSNIVKEKYKKTCQDKYGVDHPMMLESTKNEIRNTFIEKGIMKTYDNKDSGEWAEKLNISRSWMNFLIRTYGFENAITYIKDHSWIETRFLTWLNENNIKYQHQKKIDNYFPDFILEDKLIVELDGLYWHSDAINSNRKYHYNKRIKYNELGFSSCFFREDEVLNNFDIISSIVKNKLGLSSEKLAARKCKIYKISKKVAKEFLNNNHLMGNGKGDSLILAQENDIKCILQYYIHSNIIHISRFCNKLNLNVIGGFSRLLSKLPHFDIINFVDLRYGTGDHLYNLGFNKESEHISFRWIKNCTTIGRMKYPGKTGYDNGYNRIYDCGQAKFILKR